MVHGPFQMSAMHIQQALCICYHSRGNNTECLCATLPPEFHMCSPAVLFAEDTACGTYMLRGIASYYLFLVSWVRLNSFQPTLATLLSTLCLTSFSVAIRKTLWEQTYMCESLPMLAACSYNKSTAVVTVWVVSLWKSVVLVKYLWSIFLVMFTITKFDHSIEQELRIMSIKFCLNFRWLTGPKKNLTKSHLCTWAL